MIAGEKAAIEKGQDNLPVASRDTGRTSSPDQAPQSKISYVGIILSSATSFKIDFLLLDILVLVLENTNILTLR